MEIRRLQDGLISTMGFPVLVRWHHYIEPTPRCAPLTLRQLYIITQYHWCICDTYEEHWQALNYNKTKKQELCLFLVMYTFHFIFHMSPQIDIAVKLIKIQLWQKLILMFCLVTKLTHCTLGDVAIISSMNISNATWVLILSSSINITLEYMP